jgi:hypothetical protein
MFKLSIYSELFGHGEPAGHQKSGVFSYITGGFVKLEQEAIDLVGQGAIDRLPAPVRKQLISNEVLCPLMVDEAASMEERLLAQDKLTVLVRCESSEFSEDLIAFLQQIQISQLSVIFINPADLPGLAVTAGKLEQRLLEEQRLPEQDRRLKDIRFFVLDDDQEPGVLHLSALKRDGDRPVKEPLLRQILVYESTAGDCNIELVDAWPKTGLSWFGKNPGSIAGVRPRRLKHWTQASTMMSDYRYAKELPLTGLVADDRLLSMSHGSSIPYSWGLHAKCRSCRLLAGCGGYTSQSVVHCPSYANWNDPGEAADALPAGSSAGVSNSLTLNEAIGKLFDQMIAINASSSEIVLLDYLSYEYHRAFHFSRAAQVRLAVTIFRQMDIIAETMNKESFAWQWIQTHAASTKSYLAFKTGGYKKAIAITEQAIGYAMRLLAHPSSAAMTLFISQMLLNKAKVLLTVKNYAGWEETMLANIHYLANLEATAECSGMDMTAFKSLDVGLRHWMLMEGIGQVLKFNLTHRHLPHGDRLIANISANRHDALFDEQLRQWVRLLQAVERQDKGFVSAGLPAFMASRNSAIRIGVLQGYLQTRARKMVSKLQSKQPSI